LWKVQREIYKKILKEASVLLITAVMVLSTVAVTAGTNDQSSKFMLPVATFANDEGSTNNFDMTAEIYSDDLCSLPCYDAGHTDITIDTSNLGVLGDRFYSYNAYDPSGVLKEGAVYFDSENPGSITLLKKTTSPDFIAGGTWAEDTWYGCQFNNGWLWTIDEVTGTMTLIGGGNTGLNGLAYDPTTGNMYGANSTELYTINMSSGNQTLVGPFNTGGLMIGIAFDGEGTLYGEDLGTDSLYSISTSTGAATLIGPLGINLNYAQDIAYDVTWDILYLSAYTVLPVVEGALYTCNVDTGKATKVGTFQGSAEITGFAIPYIPSQPPEKPERPEGPTRGKPGVEYTYTTTTTDPDEDQVYYKWSWGDGTYSNWLGPYNSGTTVTGSHSWSVLETYDIKVKAKDIHGAKSDWSDALTISIVENEPPNKPTITGPINGKPGVTYLYIFVTTDPDGDEVSYYVDWGDGNISGWKGPYDSGEEAFATHSWSSQGIYAIKVKAKDTLDDESDWGTLEVTCL